ncbi:LysR family transcriptional regulator, partial [Amylibacter sp.]|nr:LysR family transcriptional regulator [Amylibacter sp.]
MVDTANKFSLWGIEIFVASVEEGSISAAAKRLNSSNSTISQQLTNL